MNINAQTLQAAYEANEGVISQMKGRGWVVRPATVEEFAELVDSTMLLWPSDVWCLVQEHQGDYAAASANAEEFAQASDEAERARELRKQEGYWVA